MKHSRRYLYLGLPVLGVLFYLIYLQKATIDIIYSDYIRLTDSYLPDVWNPKKFFVADLLTRIPINYLERGINVTFFGFSVTFDRVMGILGFGLSALLVGLYCKKKQIGAVWYTALMIFMFSLNKWEMLYNGTGWVHFLAFACFYYNYLVLDRYYAGEAKKGDYGRLLWLPAVITIFVAGPYCAIYIVTLVISYGFIRVRDCVLIRQVKRRNALTAGKTRGAVIGIFIPGAGKFSGKQLLLLSAMAVWPFFVYLWSHAHAVYNYSGATELTLTEALTQNPVFFVKFFLKSFASMVLGTEFITGKLPDVPGKVWCLVGFLVILAYLLAVWMNFYYRIVDRTLFPLMMLAGGGMNHMMILVSRWIFIPNDIYGMSSRYALQYQIGIVGMFLTFALAAQAGKTAPAEEKESKDAKETKIAGEPGETGAAGKPADCRLWTFLWKRSAFRDRFLARITVVIAAVFVVGNIATTVNEMNFAKHRKVHNQYTHKLVWDFETETDEILARKLEYSKSGLREALTILKENHLNIFGQDPPYYPELLDREPD